MIKLDDLLLKKSVLVRSDLDHFSYVIRIANENIKEHTCISLCRIPLQEG